MNYVIYNYFKILNLTKNPINLKNNLLNLIYH